MPARLRRESLPTSGSVNARRRAYRAQCRARLRPTRARIRRPPPCLVSPLKKTKNKVPIETLISCSRGAPARASKAGSALGRGAAAERAPATPQRTSELRVVPVAQLPRAATSRSYLAQLSRAAISRSYQLAFTVVRAGCSRTSRWLPCSWWYRRCRFGGRRAARTTRRASLWDSQCTSRNRGTSHPRRRVARCR